MERDSEIWRKYKEEWEQLREQLSIEYQAIEQKFAGQPRGRGMDLCDQHAVEDERALIRYLNAWIDLKEKYGITEGGPKRRRELPPDFPG